MAHIGIARANVCHFDAHVVDNSSVDAECGYFNVSPISQNAFIVLYLLTFLRAFSNIRRVYLSPRRNGGNCESTHRKYAHGAGADEEDRIIHTRRDQVCVRR